MAILSSKRFFVSEKEGIPLDQIKAWFDACGAAGQGCDLVVTLRSTGGRRRQKEAAIKRLTELTGGKKNAWERLGYRFDFSARRYFWNEQEIYVTANEALFLYGWLVLDDGTFETQRYFLGNIRRRLGKAFMAEARGRTVPAEAA
jgi:hypothetical protein